MPEDNQLIMTDLLILEMKKNSERGGLEKPGELFLATRMINTPVIRIYWCLASISNHSRTFAL
jgi:hypothetical protein